MRMRTISEAAASIKASDPETALTEYALRCMVKSGTIPSVRVGCKYLVALEAIEEYLQGGQQQAKPPLHGIIRPVEVSR